MNHDADITEVSDPRDMTIDEPEAAVPEVHILKGQPTDEEIAALATVLTAARGGTHAPGPQELNRWGHPIDKLRYAVFSLQHITLLGRMHMRR
jgi:Acyl-CoA carboxylase epsilon subunit